MMLYSQPAMTPALDKNHLRGPPPPRPIKASLTMSSLGLAPAARAERAQASAFAAAAAPPPPVGLIPACWSMPALRGGGGGGGRAPQESPVLPWASPVLLSRAAESALPPLSLDAPAKTSKMPTEPSVAEVLTPPISRAPSSSSSSAESSASGGAEAAAAAAAEEGTAQPSAAWLRELFAGCLHASAAAPPGSADQLIAYDASDCPVTKRAGPFKVRLDARRNKKPNPQAAALAADPSVDPNGEIEVNAVPDPAKFNFTKVNPAEVLATVQLGGGGAAPAGGNADGGAGADAGCCCGAAPYSVLPNKFPVADTHMLLVSAQLAPQRLSPAALEALAELLASCPAESGRNGESGARNGFSASFNSWGAAASINHLHIHLTDEALPLERFEAVGEDGAPVDADTLEGGSVQLKGYPAAHVGFSYRSAAGRASLLAAIARCHAADTPYNVAFSPSGLCFLFARTKVQAEVSWKTYGERLGGFEMAGIFTAYAEETYAKLTPESIAEMLAAAAVPPPGQHA